MIGKNFKNILDFGDIRLKRPSVKKICNSVKVHIKSFHYLNVFSENLIIYIQGKIISEIPKEYLLEKYGLQLFQSWKL